MISCLKFRTANFYFVKEKNICHSVFLCTNGGALTIARVPTRSFRTLLPSVLVDYEAWKYEDVAFSGLG
jgi:hypothetical protein